MFGQYAILDEVEHKFEKDNALTWKFKPVTAEAELNIQKFLYQGRRVEVDGIVREYPPTQMEMKLRELALTFNGTNIVDDAGKPFITTDMSIEAIEEKIKTMPREMVDELYVALANATVLFGESVASKKVTKDRKK